MNGVVVIPNTTSASALIQRNDDFIMLVEVLDGGRLEFLDVVEIGDMQVESRMTLRNLTTEAGLEVIVRRIDTDISWEEKMELWGKKVR